MLCHLSTTHFAQEQPAVPAVPPDHSDHIHIPTQPAVEPGCKAGACHVLTEPAGPHSWLFRDVNVIWVTSVEILFSEVGFD